MSTIDKVKLAYTIQTTRYIERGFRFIYSLKRFATQNVAIVIGGCLVIYTVKQYSRGAQLKCTMDGRMKNKTVLITGSSIGDGLSAAIAFSKLDARVILTSEREDDLDLAIDYVTRVHSDVGHFVTYGTLDLLNQLSIRKFAGKVLKHEKELHVLVLNSSVYLGEPNPSLEGFEKQMCINHIGHVMLTNLLLPLLRKTSDSRIIATTSAHHVNADLDLHNLSCERFYDAKLCYYNSRLASCIYSRALAKRESPTVGVYVVQKESYIMEYVRRLNLHVALEVAMLPFRWMLTNSATDRCQTILHCATHADLVNGALYANCARVNWSERCEIDYETKGEDFFSLSNSMASSRNSNIFCGIISCPV